MRTMVAAAASAPGAKNSQLMSSITLCKNMIGSGIFSLPLALKVGSVFPGLMVCVVVGAICAISFYMIGFSCSVWEVGTFRDAWLKTTGPRSSWAGALDWVLFVNGILTLVTYSILMADFFSGATQGLLGPEHPLAMSRMSAIMTMACVVLIPLCLTPNLKGLAFTSALGLAAMGYAVALIFTDALSQPSLNVGGNTVPALTPSMGIFEAVALFSHSYVAHYNAPGLFFELEHRSLGRWANVVGFSYFLAILLYGSFAYAGIMRFGMTTQGNLLRMFEPTTPVMLSWLAIGVSTAMTYPLVFSPFRESCIGLICSTTGGSIDSLSNQRVAFLRRVVTFVVVLSTAVAGGFCDDLGIANALAGSVTGCIITFIFPGLMFHQSLKDLEARNNQMGGKVPSAVLLKGTAVVVCVAGVLFAVIGTAVVLVNKDRD